MQTQYVVYSKCETKGIIGIEQVYRCEWNSEEKLIPSLIPMNVLCLMILTCTMSKMRVLK